MATSVKTRMTYRSAGVDTELEEGGLQSLRQWVEKTFRFGPPVKLPLGYYANVLDIGNNTGIAISTDGVGTKILIAQLLNKLDTVGIDCVAMNVNDVICVGAVPISMVDYIAVELIDPSVLGEIAAGLYRGAEIAGISVPGGEVAQIGEMIRGEKKGLGFDLVGTCIGLVSLDRILFGRDTREGDIIIGLRSSGVHSNGLTLARRVFFDQLKWSPDRYVPEFGRTVGEELLEPTQIYVRPAMAMLRDKLPIKAFAHITSDGFLNLARADAAMGYDLVSLPDPQPVFQLIQEHGDVPEEEMFRIFNMGVGFCVVVDPSGADAVQSIADAHGFESQRIGTTVADDQKRVLIPRHHLIGENGRFSKE